jgi:hypothetical protein
MNGRMVMRLYAYNPVQSTTKVWGDGNLFNGIAPGYPDDIIPAGGSIVLDNTMPANPRVSSNYFYDGKDKITSSGQIAVTQVCGEPTYMGGSMHEDQCYGYDRLRKFIYDPGRPEF